MKNLFFILLLLTQAAIAQVDSLRHSADSIKTSVDQRVDSIQNSFNNQVDSLKQSYGKAKSKIESAKAGYQQKIDSLNNLKLPTDRYTKKIDSLDHALVQVQQKTTAQIEKLKNGVTSKIKALNLPSEATGKIASLTSSMDKINLPSIDAEVSSKLGLDKINGALPTLPSEGMNTSLPSANLPNTNMPDVNGAIPAVNTPDLNVQENLGKVNDITGKVGEIQQQVKEGVTMENAEKVIESKASALDQVKALQKNSGLPVQAPASGDEAKEQLMALAKQEAVNHFAGKEAVLMEAMDKMTKYKEKYNSATSIKDLPEKPPNPLKGKPFVERLVPGITLQFQGQQYFMLDVNASLGYKFTDHITSGIGWNQRWAYSGSDGDFSPSARIYGVRSYGECHLKKGFGFRADIECMNTQVKNVTQTTESTHREWVWSAFTGIKQEYRITKNLRGNAQVMYNLFDPEYKSPYADRINVRMGFEYAIKKKPGKRDN